MAHLMRSKKMAFCSLTDVGTLTGHIQRKMVRIVPWRIEFLGSTGANSWRDWALRR
jgi:hypothetical protein